MYILYGHHNEIVALRTNSILNLIISADLDGVVMMHTLITGRYIASY